MARAYLNKREAVREAQKIADSVCQEDFVLIPGIAVCDACKKIWFAGVEHNGNIFFAPPPLECPFCKETKGRYIE